MITCCTLRKLCGVAFLGVACTAATYADLVPISNTGFTVLGTLQTSGGIDGNYTLVAFPTSDGNTFAGTGTASVYPANTYPLVSGPWVSNTATAQWITETGGNQGQYGGTYIYQTTFDLTSPGTVTLAGEWATDNTGVGIFINQSVASILNNTAPIQGPPTCFGCFGSLSPLSVTGAGIVGVNTVDFEVFNGLDSQYGPNPSGLIVDDLSLSETPEPGFYGILGLAIASLFIAVRRRRA